MVFRKRYTSKRRYGRKGSKLNPVQKRQVKRIIAGDTELKAINSTITQNPSATGALVRVGTPAQGVGLSERVGDQITLKKLQVRLAVTGADTTQKVRIIIFRWTQDVSIGANVPTVASILQTSDVLSFYNYTSYQNDRMRILYDRTVYLSNSGTFVKPVSITLYGKRLGKKIMEFVATSTLGTNQIYILFISDSTAVAHPAVDGYAQLSYVDA